jgi:hypothetical protein
MASKDTFRRLLVRRAKRLVELLEVSAPEQLIAREIVLVFKAGVGTFPTLVFHVFQRWLLGSVRSESNYCATCESAVDGNLALCPSCLKAEQEAEADLPRLFSTEDNDGPKPPG